MTIEQRSLSNTHLDQGSVFKIFYELRQDTILSHFKQKRFLVYYNIQLYILSIIERKIFLGLHAHSSLL